VTELTDEEIMQNAVEAFGMFRGVRPCVHCRAVPCHIDKQPPHTTVFCSACRRVREDLWFNKDTCCVEHKTNDSP